VLLYTHPYGGLVDKREFIVGGVYIARQSKEKADGKKTLREKAKRTMNRSN
jgi:hypothetical protein